MPAGHCAATESSTVVVPARRCKLLREHAQGRRQVEICGVDRHGERGVRAYNGGLEAARPPYPFPRKNSSDLYQFQQRPLAKVG